MSLAELVGAARRNEIDLTRLALSPLLRASNRLYA